MSNRHERDPEFGKRTWQLNVSIKRLSSVHKLTTTQFETLIYNSKDHKCQHSLVVFSLSFGLCPKHLLNIRMSESRAEHSLLQIIVIHQPTFKYQKYNFYKCIVHASFKNVFATLSADNL